ncbi:MAG: hypothetical protein ACRDHW_01375 [Ktedonobacteraceae bacterium]
MITFENITEYFLRAAAPLGLTTHPEYWLNSRTMEREFACVCHMHSCEDTEDGSACTLSFSWSTLDTALSLEGPLGVCDFYHEPDEHCPHLHTSDIPPLMLDLSYNLPFKGVRPDLNDPQLLSLVQVLRLRASEHSSRASETRPGFALTLQENRFQAEALTLQQHVELPIWHPNGMRSLHDAPQTRSTRSIQRYHRVNDENSDEREEAEAAADHPHPEEWLPQVMEEIAQDIQRVLEAMETAYPEYREV